MNTAMGGQQFWIRWTLPVGVALLLVVGKGKSLTPSAFLPPGCWCCYTGGRLVLQGAVLGSGTMVWGYLESDVLNVEM